MAPESSPPQTGPATTLIFGWGNPGRGDDGLGPRFVEQLEALAMRHPEWGAVEFLCDFQLQVEHALDLRGKRRVLFVDASLHSAGPFSVSTVSATRDASFTSHAMSPQAVLHAWTLIEEAPPPPALLLSLRGECFEPGAQMSAAAEENLAAALAWAENWLSNEPAA